MIFIVQFAQFLYTAHLGKYHICHRRDAIIFLHHKKHMLQSVQASVFEYCACDDGACVNYFVVVSGLPFRYIRSFRVRLGLFSYKAYAQAKVPRKNVLNRNGFTIPKSLTFDNPEKEKTPMLCKGVVVVNFVSTRSSFPPIQLLLIIVTPGWCHSSAPGTWIKYYMM